KSGHRREPPGSRPDRRGGDPDSRGDRSRLYGRGRPPARCGHEHQEVDGPRLLSRPQAPQRPASSRTAYAHQRAHPQRAGQGDRRQEKSDEVGTSTMAKPALRARKKEKKNIAVGVAHVAATFNNTIITISDGQGNTISWSSA